MNNNYYLFNNALNSPQPMWSLREAVQHLLTMKQTQEAVLAELEDFQALLQNEEREEDEDVVLEVMDFLTGWCSPHMTLSETPLPLSASPTFHHLSPVLAQPLAH